MKTIRTSEFTRQLVRERAKGRCEYCHKPVGLGTMPFHVDHIIPPMHGGTSEADNLAWACFECNIRKGTNIASIDAVTGQLAPLFHPRRHTWSEHFEIQRYVIVGLSPIGRVTCALLSMNTPEQMDTRRAIQRMRKRGLLEDEAD